MLSKKRKPDENETVALTEECSAILLNKLPPKLKDPGSFKLPCTIGEFYNFNALCDLGASVNLMPLSVYRRLGLGKVKATSVSLQLADRSIKYPRGVVEDVVIKVDKFFFPVDFIVLDIEEDQNMPVILGRPFLATSRALIDVEKGELSLRVQDEQAVFSMYTIPEQPIGLEECFRVDEGVKIGQENSKQATALRHLDGIILAQRLGLSVLWVESDSTLAIHCITKGGGPWHIQATLRHIRHLLALDRDTITHIFREGNQVAYLLASEGWDRRYYYEYSSQDLPRRHRSLVQIDRFGLPTVRGL
ncbi:Aspartic peptidase domain containing protein [Abeliophyllum distichum]|uniref:Aspartic peptidase domain containing protein n=1 Tax=Abeliophyllum distichum TaxID=126358 RepID=A0ABD1VZQ9_9LAMI